MADRFITVEIDSTAIKLMETSERKITKWASLSLEPTTVEGGEVTKWASLSLEPTTVKGKEVSEPLALSAAVKQLMASSGIRGKDAIVSVSGLYSLNRILAIPSTPGEPITRETVVGVVKDVIPLDTDELYLSWQTITTGENSQQVLVLGVPRDMVDTVMRALRTAGINPRILDFKAMALARAVNREQALILNIEPYSFDIIMVVNGISEIMRTIAWQQDELTAEDKAEHLAVNLELTVSFYNSRYPNTPLDPATPLFITGQMSGDLTLMENLQARVGYSIEPLAPPLDYPAHLPVSQYAVNIGLALKGMEPSKHPEQGGYSPPDINLLPESYKPWKPSTRQIYFFCGILAAIALLFPLYQVTTDAMAKTDDLQKTYTTLNNKQQLRLVEIKNREPLQKAINEYQSIVNMGGGFIEDLEVINSQAEELGVQVQSISHVGKTITMTCQTEPESYTNFRKYIISLEESGRFSTPIPPSEGYPFTTGGTIRLEPNPSE